MGELGTEGWTLDRGVKSPSPSTNYDFWMTGELVTEYRISYNLHDCMPLKFSLQLCIAALTARRTYRMRERLIYVTKLGRVGGIH